MDTAECACGAPQPRAYADGDPAKQLAFSAPGRRREGEGATLGTLIVVRPNGKWSVVADISDFEAANNPDDGVSDSNPYGLLAEQGRQYVTDAGGGEVLRIAP